MDCSLLAVHPVGPLSDRRRAVGIGGEAQGEIYV